MYYRKFTRSSNHDILWILVDNDFTDRNSIFESSTLFDNKFSPENWKKKHISDHIITGAKLIISESSNL